MHHIRTTAVTALLTGGLFITTAPADAADGGGKPSIQVLERTGHADQQWLQSVNDIGAHGLAVGQSGGVPVYWKGTAVHRVPLPSGYTGGAVNAVNSRGVMVGYVDGATGHRAFSYRLGAGSLTLLPSSGGWSEARDINASGTIVGSQDTPNDDGAVWKHRTVVATTPEPLRSVNDSGAMVGTATDPDTEFVNAFVRPGGPDGPATKLEPGIFPLGDEDWTGGAIDNHGRVVGGQSSFMNYMSHQAWYWDSPYDTTAAKVPGLPGAELGAHFNGTSPDSGLVVGQSKGHYRDDVGWAVEQQAIVWPGHGPVVALPRLSDTEPTEGAEAQSSSDNGTVGGWSYDAAGQKQPVLWKCELR